MQEHHMAPCGLDCAQCDMYVATRADSDDMRDAVASKWSALFQYNFTRQDINCDGCLGGGKMGLYCQTMCKVRPCALQRGLRSCNDCPDYECEALRSTRAASAQYTP